MGGRQGELVVVGVVGEVQIQLQGVGTEVTSGGHPHVVVDAEEIASQGFFVDFYDSLIWYGVMGCAYSLWHI